MSRLIFNILEVVIEGKSVKNIISCILDFSLDRAEVMGKLRWEEKVTIIHLGLVISPNKNMIFTIRTYKHLTKVIFVRYY